MLDQDTIYSMRLSPELLARIDHAVGATGLKKVDVIRLSIERGIDLLVTQLTTNPTQEPS